MSRPRSRAVTLHQGCKQRLIAVEQRRSLLWSRRMALWMMKEKIVAAMERAWGMVFVHGVAITCEMKTPDIRLTVDLENVALVMRARAAKSAYELIYIF